MKHRLPLPRLRRRARGRVKVQRNTAGSIISQLVPATIVPTNMIPTSVRKTRTNWVREVVQRPKPRAEAVEVKALPDQIVVARRVARARARDVASQEIVKILRQGTKARPKAQVDPREVREKEQPHLPKLNIITSTFACVLTI